MSDYLITVNGAGTATGFVLRSSVDSPREEASGNLPWFKDATLTKPSPEPWEQLTGPVYDIEAGTIVYGLEDMALDGLKEAKKTAINELRDQKAAAGKYNATVDATFKVSPVHGGYAQSAKFQKDNSAETQTRNISDITLGSPTVVRSNGNQFSVGDKVYMTGIVGTTELNGTTQVVIVDGGNDISLDIDSTNFTAYVSGGTTQLGGAIIAVDDSIIGMTADDLNTVADDISDSGGLLTINAVRLKNQVDALSDAEAIYSFDIDQGWP